MDMMPTIVRPDYPYWGVTSIVANTSFSNVGSVIGAMRVEVLWSCLPCQRHALSILTSSATPPLLIVNQRTPLPHQRQWPYCRRTHNQSGSPRPPWNCAARRPHRHPFGSPAVELDAHIDLSCADVQPELPPNRRSRASLSGHGRLLYDAGMSPRYVASMNVLLSGCS